MHENVGRKNKYLPLNKAYALVVAHEQNLLKSPFAVIHPDMVLMNPLDEPQTNITFQTDSSVGTLVEKIKPLLEDFAKVNKFDVKLLPETIPLGSTMIFKDVPADFFRRVYSRMNLLVQENSDADWDLAKAAWMMTMYENVATLKYTSAWFECRLIDNEYPANLVHYRLGLPPAFSKKYYSDNISFDNDPHDMLLAHSPTSSTEFIQKVIRNYRQ
jgi:hypothetical protein